MSWQSTSVAVGVPAMSAALGYLAYQRSRKVDKITAQSGVVTESRAGVQQLIDAQDKLVDQLQDDNQEWRAKFGELRAQLETCFTERQVLQREVNRMYRKYGDNGETPPKGTPVTP